MNILLQDCAELGALASSLDQVWTMSGNAGIPVRVSPKETTIKKDSLIVAIRN
jgi:hypothetical protein